ncbi:MAG: CDGSH iron-sulfur domain-containing protein [Tannerellaceae bacterium]|nr:CDGSH iron-sulfur domain-containing protein [Tannerellaceae bacterium]
MEDVKKVKVLKDGPYQVTGAVCLDELKYITNHRGFALEYEKVQQYPGKESYCLCRCGLSQKKPYCDGAHINGFDGTETASHKTYDEMAKFIPGKQMDLLDAEDLCAVARFCDTKSGTWNLVGTAENPEAVDIVRHHCTYCPSGRLTMVTKEGNRIEPYLLKEISLLVDPLAPEKGPLWVKGGIEIEDADGTCYPVRNRVTLCCCGKSKNKPFCDATHMGDDE